MATASLPLRREVMRFVSVAGIVAGTVALSLACSSDETNGPGPTPTAMSVASGNNQSGVKGTTLPEPLVVLVEDDVAQPLAGVTINWTVVAGGGTLGATSSTTGADGEAQVTYTLGPDAGTNQVRASVAGAPLQATFTATAQEPPPDVTPASIVIVGGNNQSGTTGTALADSLRVQVRNAANASLPGITVSWAVTAGGGTLGTTSVITSADGVAANAYTLGANAGPNTVTATVVGVGTLTATFTATGVADLTPATITIVSGNNQSATVNSALAQPLVVRVKNAGGENLSNVTVAWTVTAGGGALGAPTSVTDAQGQASNSYMVGGTAGVNTVQAAVQSNTAVNTSFTATGTALAGTAGVTVSNFLFTPPSVQLAAGGTVTWTWAGGTHNVTWVGGGFTDSSDKSSGTYQVTFPAAGTYSYYCSIHGTPTTGMRGSVTVQ